MSRAKLISHEQLIALIEQRTREKGTAKAAAESMGITPGYLSDIMSGKRHPGPSVAAAFGLEPVVYFREI